MPVVSVEEEEEEEEEEGVFKKHDVAKVAKAKRHAQASSPYEDAASLLRVCWALYKVRLST